MDLLSVVCSLTYLKDVDIIRGDFLDINPGDPLFAKVISRLTIPVTKICRVVLIFRRNTENLLQKMALIKNI